MQNPESTTEKGQPGRPPLCGRCSKPKRPDNPDYKDAEGYCECGRPTKFTEDTIQKLKDAFAIDATIPQACKYAEIGKTVFYEWLKENSKFAEEIEAMREALPLKAKENIALKIHGKPTQGDIGLSKWLVERKELHETLLIKHSGNVSHEPLNLDDDNDPEQKELLQDYLNKRRASRQRRAVEEDKRLQDLKAQKNGQNANNNSNDQLDNNNSLDRVSDNGAPVIPPTDSSNNIK